MSTLGLAGDEAVVGAVAKERVRIADETVSAQRPSRAAPAEFAGDDPGADGVETPPAADPRAVPPPLAASRGALPALNDGLLETGIDSVSPVWGWRPALAGLSFTTTVPKPARRMSSPCTRASPIMLSMHSMAAPAACPDRSSRSAMRLSMSALFPCRFPGWGSDDGATVANCDICLPPPHLS